MGPRYIKDVNVGDIWIISGRTRVQVTRVEAHKVYLANISIPGHHEYAWSATDIKAVSGFDWRYIPAFPPSIKYPEGI